MKSVTVLVGLCSLLVGAGGAHAEVRFALVVGNNEGTAGRAKLWFAERDAQRMAHALRELGAFPEANVLLLEGEGPDALSAALSTLEARIEAAQQARERTLLVVYYSGHADAEGLQLGEARFPFGQLRDALTRSRAEVKVAIIDACESGALTQVKGARPVASPAFPLPGEETVKGVAYLASTALGEYAQESAELGGSFFTHHLEVGLRGAADADDDGRVTLTEAFRYTAARTTLGTLGTEVGPQHPTYELRMSGRGDLVLSDLRRAEARLVLPAAPGATWFLRGPKGLLAEVGGSDVPRTLALPAGPYHVERRRGGRREVSAVVLPPGALRGLPEPERILPLVSGRKGGGEAVSFGLELGVGARSGTLPEAGLQPSLRLGLRADLAGVPTLRARMRGSQVVAEEQGGLAYRERMLQFAAGALVPVARWRALRLELGAEVALARVFQDVHSGERFRAWTAGLNGVTAGWLDVGRWHFGVEGAAGVTRVPVNGTPRTRPALELSLLGAWVL